MKNFWKKLKKMYRKIRLVKPGFQYTILFGNCSLRFHVHVERLKPKRTPKSKRITAGRGEHLNDVGHVTILATNNSGNQSAVKGERATNV